MNEPLLVFDSGRLKALDPDTGAVRWTSEVPDGSPAYRRMALTEGVVLVAGYEWLYCLNAAAGTPLWRIPTRKGGPLGLIARSGKVYLYKKGAVDCYDGKGQRVWTHEAESTSAASLGMGDEVFWIPDPSV